MDEMNMIENFAGSEVNGKMSTKDILTVGGIGAGIGALLIGGVVLVTKVVKTYKKGKEAQARENAECEYEDLD